MTKIATFTPGLVHCSAPQDQAELQLTFTSCESQAVTHS
ncbi:hypothetical protein PF003_g34228 [Phytophthora fragariae]|nr:hypothetical protein PF003_g34228 [Phytophthora fragariae]